MNMSLVLRLPQKMHLCRSSSNVPRLPSCLEMSQNPHVLLTFDKVHDPLRLPRETTSERPKVVRTPGAFHINFEMCFAPQGRALFRHLNFQNWSKPLVFLTFWLRNVLAPQRRALFRHLNFQNWSENGVFCTCLLRNVLRATTACNFSSLIRPPSSAPAALASLLFDPPEPRIIGKTQCFATFLPFRAPGSSFFWLFLFLLLFSSLTLPISAFHLSILSEVWLLNFLRWTLKQLAQLTLVSTALALDLTLARFELHPIHSLCQVQQGRIWCVALAMAAWRGCWPLTGSWAHQQRSVGIGSWRIQDLTSGLWTPVGIHLLLLCWFSGAQHQQLAILTRKAPTIWGMCRARGSTQRRSRSTATMKVMWHEWKAVCGRASLLRDLQGSGWQRQPRRLVRLRSSWSWTGHAAGGLRCHLGCHLWSLGRRRRLNWYSRCANSRAQWARLSSRKLWDWWNWLWHWRKYLGCRWRRAPWCWKWGRWPFWRWRLDAWTWVWRSWKGHRWGGRGGSSRRWCHGCCGCPHILLQGIGSQNWDKYTHKVRNLRRGTKASP